MTMHDRLRVDVEKVRENRLRRMAERQGLILRRNRRRDPRALDFGTYVLIDARQNFIVAGSANGVPTMRTLDDVEDWLTRK